MRKKRLASRIIHGEPREGTQFAHGWEVGWSLGHDRYDAPRGQNSKICTVPVVYTHALVVRTLYNGIAIYDSPGIPDHVIGGGGRPSFSELQVL